eukprot:CAMPEP_0119101850 /NCGR_PEP_ID=MMETSP1180-20130426/784_1 /TAXON_ID=3052 ORGANISM="Chlamydomonas cf sp, Strain CCMP681" /NCGR_SAMPLE_ID=MMETSP1180 /ASSEMBLY_ACC=CAM_ASM_000741 /LENGTH=147 /DNA_ID=CAMNT_0007086031 /DNA_START=48 /DNA_END=491 /DNA_ORIENTATION=-
MQVLRPLPLAALCVPLQSSIWASTAGMRAWCSFTLPQRSGSATTHASSSSCPHLAQQPSTGSWATVQARRMAVWVQVEDNNLGAAMRQLNRRVKDSGLMEEMRKRKHHMIKSKLRFEKEKKAYNREMARRITEKLFWLRKRKYVALL